MRSGVTLAASMAGNPGPGAPAGVTPAASMASHPGSGAGAGAGGGDRRARLAAIQAQAKAETLACLRAQPRFPPLPFLQPAPRRTAAKTMAKAKPPPATRSVRPFLTLTMDELEVQPGDMAALAQRPGFSVVLRAQNHGLFLIVCFPCFSFVALSTFLDMVPMGLTHVVPPRPHGTKTPSTR